MKVALLIDTLEIGGAQKQIINLTKGLIKYKNLDEVSLHYYYKTNLYSNELRDLKENVICHYIGKNKIFKLISLLNTFFALLKYDAIITFLPRPSLLASFVKVFDKKIKLIISERNSNLSNEYFKNKFIDNFVKTNSNFITTNSFTRYKKLKFKFPNKIVFVNNGYEEISDNKKHRRDLAFSYKSSDEIRIILIGRISKQKNILGAIKAMKYLSHRYRGKKIILDVFGRVDEYKYFEDCIDLVNDINNKFINISFKKSSTKWISYINNYDLLLLPSFFEGMSNVIIESMSVGLLVCCSNIEENKKVIGNWCKKFTFDPFKSDEIAKSISCLIESDESELNKIRKEGFIRFRNNFNLKKLAKAYYSLL